MEELKKYLTPSLDILEISADVFTESSENNVIDDPYSSGNNWWEKNN